MIAIDYQNRQPIYEQIVERFEMLIISGALPFGTQMPSVRSLAVELSINPNTIQKAYAVLEQKGYIYPVKGKGNFVADCGEVRKNKRETVTRELTALLAQARASGMTERECHEIVQECFEKGGSL